jgi:hypothetical protein
VSVLRPGIVVGRLKGLKIYFRENLLEFKAFSQPAVRGVKVAINIEERKRDPCNHHITQKLSSVRSLIAPLIPSHSPLTTHQLSLRGQEVDVAHGHCARQFGQDSKRFGPYSPRIGGATKLRAGDAASGTVKDVGRWRSARSILVLLE